MSKMSFGRSKKKPAAAAATTAAGATAAADEATATPQGQEAAVETPKSGGKAKRSFSFGSKKTKKAAAEGANTPPTTPGAVRSFTFEAGPIGMTLGTRNGTTRVLGTVPGSQSASANVPLDAELMSIGGEGVEGSSVEAIQGLIKATPRPVVIEVREQAAGAGTEAGAAPAAASSGTPQKRSYSFGFRSKAKGK